MNIKRVIKKLLCPMQCARFNIKNRNGFLYIGKACKIENSKNIIFGQDVSVAPYSMLICHDSVSKMSIGEGTQIGMFSRIASKNCVKIGRNVLMGPHIFIADYNHEYRDISKPIMHQGTYGSIQCEGVEIGDDSWIGTNVVIAGTVKIGKHCVIGANSVVTKDIPDYSVAVGTPCKVIKQYNVKNNTWEYIK